jgi:hypothetical protein
MSASPRTSAGGISGKAVLLNLLSLATALGIVVFVFQQGHGSSLWSIAATQSVIAWIPVMIFAFLFGLSMGYEVFMLTRMREAYDETGSTNKAIELGLARTGKLVTSAALILESGPAITRPFPCDRRTALSRRRRSGSRAARRCSARERSRRGAGGGR